MWLNSIYNLLGMGIPLVAAFFSMGALSRLLGVENFGLFLIIFSIIGYSTMFDGGVSRAVIRQIATNAGNRQEDRLTMGTATIVVFLLSIVAAAILFLFSNRIITLINVSLANIQDGTAALHLTALAFIPTLVSLVWFGFLEGKQEFKHLNAYKTITGILTAILPVISAYFLPTLTGAIAGLLIAKLLTLIFSAIPVIRAIGFCLHLFSKTLLKQLLSFGSWIFVSNIISPLMVNSDRLILSSMLGAQKIALYAAPSELIMRLGVVPSSLGRVLFPMLSEHDNGQLLHLKSAYRGLAILMICIIIPMIYFSHLLLTIWLGDAYGMESTAILRILLVGFFFNALAQIPYSHIQATGNSRLTALIHIIEIIPYFIALFYLVKYFGLTGAALAWSARVIADYVALQTFSNHLTKYRTIDYSKNVYQADVN